MGRKGIGLTTAAAMAVVALACSSCGGGGSAASASSGVSCHLVDGGAVPPFTPVNAGATACGICAFGSTTAPSGSPYCYMPPASQQPSMLAMCTSQGGVLLAGCPTAGLVGCCTVSKIEQCYYWGSATEQQTQCMKTSGTWSTSP